MKRFLLVCVTYNSYEELLGFLRSVDEACCLAKSVFEVDVLVADNTTEHVQQVAYTPDSLQHLQVCAFHENLGYFGAAQKAMQEIKDIHQYDYVAISNVDLLMPSDFFTRLGSLDVAENVGWVANAILSGLEKRDRNPKILQRYSKGRLNQLHTLFRFPILHYLYTKTLYRRKKVMAKTEARKIYAGHGSFVLLTKAFFNAYPALSYPIFLFCEEIYLAELCREAGLSVWYEPSLIINDTEHCSTGKMKKSFYYRCNYDAISYILKTYYQ